MGLSARITGGGVKTVIVTGDTDFVPHAATAKVGQPTPPATAQGCAYAARVVRAAAWLVVVAGAKGAAAAAVISKRLRPRSLARYMASSARCRAVPADSLPAHTVTPTLTVSAMLRCSVTTGWASTIARSR